MQECSALSRDQTYALSRAGKPRKQSKRPQLVIQRIGINNVKCPGSPGWGANNYKDLDRDLSFYNLLFT